MMNRTIGLLLLLCTAGTGAAEIRLDFSKNPAVELRDGARIADGALILDGKKSYALIPGSESAGIGPEGLTVSCIARFDPRAKAGQDLIFKPGSFMLSRFGSGALTGMIHAGDWTGRAGGGKVMPVRPWAHYAMTVEPVRYPGEGKQGYRTKVYINGELEGAAETLHITADNAKTPLMLGRGNAGDVWAMHGRMARFACYDRVLSEEELEREIVESGLIALTRRGRTPLSDDLQAALRSAPLPEAWRSWVTGAISRAAGNNADQRALAAMLRRIPADAAQAETLEAFAMRWNQAAQSGRILCSERLAALFLDRIPGAHFPLAGLYDRQAKREIFGRHSIDWNMVLSENGKRRTINSFDPDSPRLASVAGKCMTVSYPRAEATVDVTLTLLDDRLECALAAEASPACRIEEVTFPVLRLRKMTQGADRMLYPVMDGEVIDNPTENGSRRVKQNWYYPSTYVSMQFGAYYDDAGGVYFAQEDPTGAVKNYSATGRGGEIEVAWKNYAPWRPGQRGGNSFRLSGPGVLQPFRGNWYDAARIYRRFALEKADWRVGELPRTDTPEWFRNCSLWILVRPRQDKLEPGWVDQLIALRDYFELPYGVHLYDWDDFGAGHFPHFNISARSQEEFKRLRAGGIYLKPYIDSRLWAVRDGGRYERDWMFGSHGKPFAVKNQDGAMNYEYYNPDFSRGEKKFAKAEPFAIMCPGAPGWQNWMRQLVERVVSYGSDAVYHDETAAARPYLCFDASHGHLLNDPSVWRSGHRAIFAPLRKSMPRVAHDTEEAAEPYLDLLDGFMCWRWRGKTPVFMAIYSGRTQITGRLFFWPYEEPSKYRQFFVKAGIQLVSAEQLGWFFPFDMKDGAKRLYAKKLMHLRHALLDWFNGGEMLAPMRYLKSPGTLQCDWGAMQGQGGIVETDRVLSGVFGRPDGLRVAVFVNTSPDPVTFQPDLAQYRPKVIAGLGEQGAWAPGEVTLPPGSTGVILIGERDDAIFQAARERLAASLQRIGTFRP